MALVDMKTCTQCGEEKEIDAFPLHGVRGRLAQCRDCFRPKRKEYQARWNRTEAGKRSLAASHIKARYGITGEQYAEMVSRQRGLCALCGCPPRGKRLALCVDHDHATNKIRGLLCDTCNKGLGHFRDDVELLAKAIAYLESR